MAEAPKATPDTATRVAVLLRAAPGDRRAALAWLVSPTAALTDGNAVEPARNRAQQSSFAPGLTLSTLDGRWTSPATIQGTDPELGVALVALERPLEVPDLGVLRQRAPESGEEWHAATADGRLVHGKVIRAPLPSTITPAAWSPIPVRWLRAPST